MLLYALPWMMTSTLAFWLMNALKDNYAADDIIEMCSSSQPYESMMSSSLISQALSLPDGRAP